MALWTVIGYREFPIYTVAHKVIKREVLDGERVKWLVDAPETIEYFPTAARGIHSVKSAETDDVAA